MYSKARLSASVFLYGFNPELSHLQPNFVQIICLFRTPALPDVNYAKNRPSPFSWFIGKKGHVDHGV